MTSDWRQQPNPMPRTAQYLAIPVSLVAKYRSHRFAELIDELDVLHVGWWADFEDVAREHVAIRWGSRRILCTLFARTQSGDCYRYFRRNSGERGTPYFEIKRPGSSIGWEPA